MKKSKSKYYYPAVFYESEIGYVVKFPDFDYIATQGKDFEEAYEKAVEVLGIGVEDALSGEIKLPIPSNLSDVKMDPEIGDPNTAEKVIIVVDMNDWMARFSSKTVRRNITLPEALDQALRKKKINVSRVCQEALLKEINLR